VNCDNLCLFIQFYSGLDSSHVFSLICRRHYCEGVYNMVFNVLYYHFYLRVFPLKGTVSRDGGWG
jgi:hypothetical protein